MKNTATIAPPIETVEDLDGLMWVSRERIAPLIDTTPERLYWKIRYGSVEGRRIGGEVMVSAAWVKRVVFGQEPPVVQDTTKPCM